MKNKAKVEMIQNNRGFVSAPGFGVMSFEVQGVSAREDIRSQEFRTIYSKFATDRLGVRLGEFFVPMWGDNHNLYPLEVFAAVSENKILPEIIDKQIKYLYGKGPFLYTEKEVDGRIVRIPYAGDATLPAWMIQSWLDSWESKGFDDYKTYLKKISTDFYYVRTYCSRFNFNKRRRIGDYGYIDGLSYVGADEARPATVDNYTFKRVKLEDCKYIIVGDWLNIGLNDYEVFPKFDATAPNRYPTAISFNADKTFTKWVHAYNTWFAGIQEWIKASNLTPKYLNSYLKNALNSFMHCTIPLTWYNHQEEILKNIIERNINPMDENTPITKEWNGVKLVDDWGKPYPYYEAMMNEVVKNKLEEFTAMMSGEGKNQGKLTATLKYGEEGWEFKEMPGDFKEYFDAVISFDRRADEVQTSSLGISASITNVEKDGVLSKSGSDIYYNMVNYKDTIYWDEEFVTKDINRAIQIQFPAAKKLGVKLGFRIDMPARTSEITPKNRIENTTGTTAQ